MAKEQETQLIIDKRYGDEKPKTFITSEGILKRFDTLCNDYDAYTKTSIFNKLLDDGLKKYGY